MELAPGSTDTEGGPLWSWGPTEASLDKSHPVRGTAGLQAKDSAPSQEEATGRRLSGQRCTNTTSPSPARDTLDHSVLGFCWKQMDYGSKGTNNGKNQVWSDHHGESGAFHQTLHLPQHTPDPHCPTP